MNGKSVAFLLGLATLVATQNATPDKSKSMLVDDNLYVYDNAVLRNRSMALAYCTEQGGELTKMNKLKIYNILRNIVPAGAASYWIDGMDSEKPDRFIATETCTDGPLDFTDIKEANLDFKSANCLVLAKGTTAANSKIQAVPCSNYYKGVICTIPVATGCKEPEEETGDGDGSAGSGSTGSGSAGSGGSAAPGGGGK